MDNKKDNTEFTPSNCDWINPKPISKLSSNERIEKLLEDIAWIKKRLPHQLVESVFRDIDSYENRATKILENISKEV